MRKEGGGAHICILFQNIHKMSIFSKQCIHVVTYILLQYDNNKKKKKKELNDCLITLKKNRFKKNQPINTKLYIQLRYKNLFQDHIYSIRNIQNLYTYVCNIHLSVHIKQDIVLNSIDFSLFLLCGS